MSRSPAGVGTAARRGLLRDVAPAVVVAAGILVAATVPVGAPQPAPDWSDTAAHVTMYALLAGTLLRAWHARGWPRPVLGPVAATVAYGVFHELVQAALPWRTAAVGDVVADAAGAVLAAVATRWWPRLLGPTRARPRRR